MGVKLSVDIELYNEVEEPVTWTKCQHSTNSWYFFFFEINKHQLLKNSVISLSAALR
jgi:hypothetical protein